MAETIKFLSYTGLSQYDGLIKGYVDDAVNAVGVETAKAFKAVALEGNVLHFYLEDPRTEESVAKYSVTLPFADYQVLVKTAVAGNIATFDENGQVVDSGIAMADVATKAEVKEVSDALAEYKTANDAAVKANTDAIAVLNGEDTVDGSVAKAVKDAKDALQAEIDAVDAKVDKNATSIGTLDNLETTAKEDLVKAINEVRNAVSVGGTEAAITMDTTTTTEGYLKSYTIKQGSNVIGTIDIPKDMVVESGEVVVDPEGQEAGTYIKLKLANVTEPLFINVGTLVDIYKAKAEATQVQVAIDSATREISASIVAGSVGTTELADNAITTVKIANANVTKEKLSNELQASIDKADASAAQADLEAEVTAREGAVSGLDTRLQVVEAKFGEGEGNVESQIATAKQEAIDAAAADATTKANTAEENAKKHADDLNTAMNTRVEALEAIDHDHENKEAIDGITAEKVAAWDAAEQNAKDYADTEIGKVNAKIGEVPADKTVVQMIADAQTEATYDDTEVKADIAALEESLAEGGATANAIKAAQNAADKAQGEVDALEELHATDKAALDAKDAELQAAIEAIQEIPASDINALFGITE